MSFIDCLAFSWSGPSIFLDLNRLDTSWIVASRAKTTQSYINHSVAKQFPFKSHVNRSIICGSLILQLIQFVRIQGAPFRFKKHFLFWKKNLIEGIIGQCPMAVRTFPLHNWMRQETTMRWRVELAKYNSFEVKYLIRLMLFTCIEYNNKCAIILMCFATFTWEPCLSFICDEMSVLRWNASIQRAKM